MRKINLSILLFLLFFSGCGHQYSVPSYEELYQSLCDSKDSYGFYNLQGGMSPKEVLETEEIPPEFIHSWTDFEKAEEETFFSFSDSRAVLFQDLSFSFQKHYFFHEGALSRASFTASFPLYADYEDACKQIIRFVETRLTKHPDYGSVKELSQIPFDSGNKLLEPQWSDVDERGNRLSITFQDDTDEQSGRITLEVHFP